MSQQSNEPVVIQPEVISPPPDPGAMTEGATTPALGILSIKSQLKAGGATSATPSGSPGTGRKPGRQPANKPADPDKAQADALKKRAEKRKRVDEMAARMTNELNDTILSIVISQGMPSSLVYRDGKAPALVHNQDGKYTELGAKLAISPAMAHAVAGFAVELESSKTGAAIANAAENGAAGLVVKGVLAFGYTFSYIRGVREVVKQLAPLIEAKQQYEAQKNRTNEGNNINGLA